MGLMEDDYPQRMLEFKLQVESTVLYSTNDKEKDSQTQVTSV